MNELKPEGVRQQLVIYICGSTYNSTQNAARSSGSNPTSQYVVLSAATAFSTKNGTTNSRSNTRQFDPICIANLLPTTIREIKDSHKSASRLISDAISVVATLI